METLFLRYDNQLVLMISSGDYRLINWCYLGTQGLIFVIDSNDRSRIEEARQELHRIILDREMKEALLLVFANKQDIVGGTWWQWRTPKKRTLSTGLTGSYILAMTPQEVQERLKLNQLKDKIWYVVPSCATTGEGLFEGLVGFTSMS